MKIEVCASPNYVVVSCVMVEAARGSLKAIGTSLAIMQGRALIS